MRTVMRLIHLGSSPLARGTLMEQNGHVERPGLIPARAGNTHRQLAFYAELGAHPRSRGEHEPVESRYRVASGSSPLARGTRICLIRHRNSQVAHPRSRGEHLEPNRWNLY